MGKNSFSLLLAAALTSILAVGHSPVLSQSKTVVVRSGSLRLKAQLWRPEGRGPFPAVLFTHGSGAATNTPAGRRDQASRVRQAAILGPVFARHGYLFLFLYRRGAGLSAGQGIYSGDLMDTAFAANGQEGRNQTQLKLLETDEMDDALAGLSFLRELADVDARRIAVVGHSFGGSLALLLAERDTSLRAVVDFASAANSWEGSPPLRARLLSAVAHTTAPVFIIQAANDYSVEPARVLGDEMEHLGKPHRTKIYQAFGRTPDDGHSLIYLGVPTWEPDVFAFLDEQMR